MWFYILITNNYKRNYLISIHALKNSKNDLIKYFNIFKTFINDDDDEY